MGRKTDILKGGFLSSMSALGQLYPDVGRAATCLTQEGDILLRWHLFPNIRPGGNNWLRVEPTHPEHISASNLHSYENVVLKVNAQTMNERLKDFRFRPAVIYGLGEVSMVGVSNLPPHRDNFMKPWKEQDVAFVTRVGREPFIGSAAVVDLQARQVELVPTSLHDFVYQTPEGLHRV